MQVRVALPVFLCLILAGCASVGDPLPPALYIPERTTDFALIQRGPALVATFTAPALTTEALGIRELTAAELRIGPIPADFTYENWAGGAEEIPLDTPTPGEKVVREIPADRWAGREVLAAVRFAGARGRLSEWSNSVVLTPRAPLSAPAAKAAAHPEGIRVAWAPVPGATSYRVVREGADPAVVAATEYIDRNIERGKSYSYTVVAQAENAESTASPPAVAVAVDTFPPAAPSGLTALAGLNSIELAWRRSTESDFAGYRIYRAEGEGGFAVLSNAAEATAWSDRQIESGKTYQYRVTAIDRSGNESEPSATVAIAAP